MRASELRSPRLRAVEALEIERTWDVDSFIALATSLAIHRHGFRLAYRPPYLRRITQNPYVRFRGKTLHKVKNLRLGQGVASGGYHYDCHIFFPNMPLRVVNGTHLTDQEQREPRARTALGLAALDPPPPRLTPKPLVIGDQVVRRQLGPPVDVNARARR